MEGYGRETAIHYAAYRPPLHSLILSRILPTDREYPTGLDIGCGTGHSSIALANFCDIVTGLDSSKDMLSAATPHTGVNYVCGSGDHLPISSDSISLVTFAGSLFYAKSDALVAEIERVCHPNALIVSYDFDVDLNEFLARFSMTSTVSSAYDYTTGFQDREEFSESETGSEKLSIEVVPVNLAHLLLSNSGRYTDFRESFNVADPFKPLVQELETEPKLIDVQVRIYYSRYNLRS